MLLQKCDSPVYNETRKSKKLLDEKNVKTTKRSRAYKNYLTTNSVNVLSLFNLKLQLKDTEYAIRNNQLDLLTELKGF